MIKREIEIRSNHPDAVEFCVWLNENGHNARIGSTNSNFVDGINTYDNTYGNTVMNLLWDDYHNYPGEVGT